MHKSMPKARSWLILKQFWFKRWVWSLVHPCKSLEAWRFVDAENQNNVICAFQSCCQLLGWAHCRRPSAVLHRGLQVLIRIRFDHKESRSTAEYRFGSVNHFQQLFIFAFLTKLIDISFRYSILSGMKVHRAFSSVSTYIRISFILIGIVIMQWRIIVICIVEIAVVFVIVGLTGSTCIEVASY